MFINDSEIEFSGLDRKKIKSIASRISRAAKEAAEMGIEVFGGSTSGELRFRDDRDIGALKLASLDGHWDGG